MRTKSVLLGIGCLACCVVFFLAGDSVGQRSRNHQFAIGVNSIQAMLAFNRLQDERNWASLLAEGCLKQLATELDAGQNEELMLLAGYAPGQLDDDTIKYIDDRDPPLRAKLRTFKNKYGGGWSEHACNR